MRIQIDFDAVSDAAAVLTSAAVAPLPDTAATGRAPVDNALEQVRDRWRADPLPQDVTEAGARLSASATDLRNTEDAAVSGLRSIEATLG